MKHLYVFLCFVFSANLLFAQSTISGTVKDSQSANVIPGVTVIVKGKGASTQTDAAGRFTLTASLLTRLLLPLSVMFRVLFL